MKTLTYSIEAINKVLTFVDNSTRPHGQVKEMINILQAGELSPDEPVEVPKKTTKKGK